MRLRLSTLIRTTLFAFSATILLLFLPAMRSYLSSEGPIEEVREDLTQFQALQHFSYLVERRSLETMDVVFAGEDMDQLHETDAEIAELLATLRRTVEAEEETEADEIATVEALEALDRRLRQETESLFEKSHHLDRDALTESAYATWGQMRKDVTSIVPEALLREANAVSTSLDTLLAASGHFGVVPFLPLGEKTNALRASAMLAREAGRFTIFFERMAGEYSAASLLGTTRVRVDGARALADQAFSEWRLHIGTQTDSQVPIHEIGSAYTRICELGESLFALGDPEERLAAYAESFEPLADARMSALLVASMSAYQETLTAILDEIESYFTVAGAVIVAVAVALAGLMLLGPWMLARWVIHPISDLALAARDVGEGDLSRRVRVHGSRELVELIRNFNDTVEALAELQERLKRHERLSVLGEIAGSIGHEIRNPLGAMRSSIYFLRMRRDKTIDAKAEEHLERIERQIRRADRIVTELLDYARRPSSSPRSMDLRDVLDEVVQSSGIPPSIGVERLDRHGCPRVHADPEQVGRILENLVRNALQAMPEGGELRLACDARGGEVAVSVADTGIGIAAESLPKIFEPLVTTKTKGIGLGLALSQRYAELNGGRIECESELGRGSLFRLILPSEAEASHDG